MNAICWVSGLLIAFSICACKGGGVQIEGQIKCDSLLRIANQYLDDLQYHNDLDTTIALFQEAANCDRENCNTWRTLISLLLEDNQYVQVKRLFEDRSYCSKRIYLDTSFHIAVLEMTGDSLNAQKLIEHALRNIGPIDTTTIKTRSESWRLDFAVLLRKAHERYNVYVQVELIEAVKNSVDEFYKQIIELPLYKLDSATLKKK